MQANRMILVVMILVLTFSMQLMAGTAFDRVQKGSSIADFRVEYLYDNGEGTTLGARFRHIPSNMILDYLQIQSVPQAYMWINTPPPSDQGEPHTCEHLLLGKGNKGRYVASLEDMSLGSSSASTYRLFTNYHYHTTAGGDVFYNLFEAKLDALLNPNFTDEEIRREVCNMGPVVDPEDGSLSLDEKGTVYTEMVSAYERSGSRLWTEMSRALYGMGHPIANVSGGFPADIRQMTPEDLREFHEDTYKLNNMGIIVALPSEYELDGTLTRLSQILKTVSPDATVGEDPATFDDRLPQPNPSQDKSIRYVEYPHQNENEPGEVVFAWPPELKLDPNSEVVLSLFLANLAEGETSDLYKKVIDTRSREIDIGANSVWGGVGYDFGMPVYIGFSNVRRDAMDESTLASIEALIDSEIELVASFEDGSEELAAYNERVRNRIISERRQLRQFLSTPPRFGYRGTGNQWMAHLKSIQKSNGDRRGLTMNERYDFVEGLLDSRRNFWKDYIAEFKLLESKPFTMAAIANPDIIEQEREAKQQRIDAFVSALKDAYEVDSDEEALAKYKAEYDRNTAVMDEIAEQMEMPTLVESPPMTLDDQLIYRVEQLPGGNPMVVSTFESMTGTSFGLAFDLYAIPEELLVYVPALPTMIDEVGVIRDGEPIDYYDMREMIRQDILYASASFDRDFSSQRAELVYRAAGTNIEESEKALEWMKLKLFSPDWRVENLSRIRDAINVSLTNLRNRMKGSEEAWVNEPALSYWRQDNPLLLSAGCFLTQAHSMFRVKWMLKEAPDREVAGEFNSFIDKLVASAEGLSMDDLEDLVAGVKAESTDLPAAAELKAHFDGMSEEAQNLASAAIHDLNQSLNEIPESSVGRDFRYVCGLIKKDLAKSPKETLADFDNVMDLLRRQDNVRSFVVASSSTQEKMLPKIVEAAGTLSDDRAATIVYKRKPLVDSRLAERNSAAQDPVYVGLINENSSTGVFVNSARCAGFFDHEPEDLTKFLSARLYGGGGGHSMFMKTWSAGLAYSNGLRSSEFSGRLSYYAERCPDLAQTMSFVVSELKNAPYDPTLTDYAVAQAFQASRAGSRYESRGEGIASDLVDGITPETVKRFRQGVMALRDDPELSKKLYDIMLPTYGTVLPGIEPNGSEVEDAVFFILGPETQFQSFEEYLRTAEGSAEEVFRLYPRDFWLTGGSEG